MHRRNVFFSILAGVLLLLGIGEWMDSKTPKSARVSARSVSALQDSDQGQSVGFQAVGAAQASNSRMEIVPVNERATTPVESPIKSRIRSRAPASVR